MASYFQVVVLVFRLGCTMSQVQFLTKGDGWTWPLTSLLIFRLCWTGPKCKSPVGFHTVNYYCADCAGIEVVLDMSQMQNGHGLQLSVGFHKTVRCSPGSRTWSPTSFWLLQNY